MKAVLFSFVFILSTFAVHAQTNGKFTPFQKTYYYNNVTIQHVKEGYEETKVLKCAISIDSRRGAVRVEMGNERPKHYLISTPGITRDLELGIKKVLSFRLSPVSGQGDYMFIKPDWSFIVLMAQEESQIYVFKNIRKE